MADEATRAVGVPPGMPVGWIAPDSAILDGGDLETMRDGLRAGKTVAIASDGHVYVSGEATGQPMTPEAQQFIESRLGVVKQLVDMSGGMTIHPDGRMFGTFANQSIKVAMGPDPSLDEDEMNLLHAGIASGASVAVLPDGSVQYALQPGTQPPSVEDVQQRLAYFDEEVRMSGDVYQTMPPPNTPNGMHFPQGGNPEPAVPTTPPLPGATPERTVGPQLADTTPPAPDQTAPDQGAPVQTAAGPDAVGDTAVATVDPAVGDVSASDGAALASDDAGFDTPTVDTSDPMPSEAFTAVDSPTYDGTGYDISGYEISPTDGIENSYASSGDSYADSGDGSVPAIDTDSPYDDGSAYDDGSGYDTGSSYDNTSYDASAADDGGDSYSYAAADASAYDGSSDDGSGYDTSGYDGSGDPV